MLRGSDLALLRNQIFRTVDLSCTPMQKEYMHFLYDEYIDINEIGLARNVRPSSIKVILLKAKERIIANKPFLRSPQSIKYKGAGRILNMIAKECDRRNSESNEQNYSYTKLFNNIELAISDVGTDVQKDIYSKFFVEGKTQQQIANELSICQTSVQKMIMGNYSYQHGKFHGGIISKLGKYLRNNNVPYCCHLIQPYGPLFSLIFKR